MNFDAAAPIYIQIGGLIRVEIISGKYQPGDRLKSVREYALFYEVSPLTMHRAIQYLESQGLIVTKKGIGSFVNPALQPTDARQLLKSQARRFTARLRQLGLSKEEILRLIQECMEELDQEEKEEGRNNGS